jgi:hypothetical protein
MNAEDPTAVGVFVAVPEIACVPLHPPLAVHEVLSVDDQVNLALAPNVMLAVSIEIDTVGADMATGVTQAPFVKT